jgi:hypothetical protein
MGVGEARASSMGAVGAVLDLAGRFFGGKWMNR